MTDVGSPGPALKPIDSFEVDVVTDNVSDTYVSKTLFAVSEFAKVVITGAKVISAEALLCANLGLGLRLISRSGEIRHTLLFDTGPERAIFLRNGANLGIHLGDVECIAGSHGHWDHMAALPDAIDAIVKEGGEVTVHVNPGMFNERVIRLANGTIVPVANVPLPADMEASGAKVVNRPEARLLLDGHFYYSGEIPRLTPFEKGRTDHLCRTSGNGLLATRSLAHGPAHAGGACPRPGIDRFQRVLACPDRQRMYRGAASLSGYSNLLRDGRVPSRRRDGADHSPDGRRTAAVRNQTYHRGHCTGWRALRALADVFGDAVSQSAVGTRYTFVAGHRPGEET